MTRSAIHPTRTGPAARAPRCAGDPVRQWPSIDRRLDRTMEYAPGLHDPVAIRYRTAGRADAPVVVALGGISADRRVDGWWQALYGPGCGLDPQRNRILGIDWLDRRWPDGSAVTTATQADALATVLDQLGVASVQALIGASYGAMVGLAFAERHPARLEQLVAISGAHCAHPMAIARRWIQRQIVQLGLATGQANRALELARALAITTYRPSDLFAERFANPQPDQVLEQISSYFELQGRRFCAQFDAERYLCLSESLDRHRVEPARIRCPVTLVAVESDDLVPPKQIRELAGLISGPTVVRSICSAYGHDAFLKEADWFNTLITQRFQQGRVS